MRCRQTSLPWVSLDGDKYLYVVNNFESLNGVKTLSLGYALLIFCLHSSESGPLALVRIVGWATFSTGCPRAFAGGRRVLNDL